MTYVVTGVSGNTGRVVAESLLAAGKSVRVIVRDAAKGESWKQKGAEVAVADVLDVASLTQALQGAQGAYLLIPPNGAVPVYRAYQDEVTRAFLAAIAGSKVPHMVFLSSVGAQHATGTGPIEGLYGAEAQLAKLQGVKVAVLRAGYFMENFATSFGMLDQGLLPSFFPADFKFPMIATKDVGSAAARLLLEGQTGTYEVHSEEPHTVGEVAQLLSELLGKAIKVHEAPVGAMAGVLQSMGVPAEMAKLYQELTEGLLAGRVAPEGKNSIFGRTALRDVLKGLLKIG